MSENLKDKQLIIARTLRSFGLVDNFGFDRLIQRGVPLTTKKIGQALSDAGVLLPPGTSVKYIAARLVAELGQLNGVDSADTMGLVVGLASITMGGGKAAGEYHDLILRIFRSLFESRLGRITKEQSIFDKTKRVDLKAENNQSEGFFNELRTRYHLYCPYVFFECKNYVDDVANREFDQLFGRLGRESTQVGAIVCRQLLDPDKALISLKQPYHSVDRKLAIVITDILIREMAEAHRQGGAEAVDDILQREYERVLLSA